MISHPSSLILNLIKIFPSPTKKLKKINSSKSHQLKDEMRAEGRTFQKNFTIDDEGKETTQKNSFIIIIKNIKGKLPRMEMRRAAKILSREIFSHLMTE